MDDERIIGLFFERSEQAIRELDAKYGRLLHKLSYNIVNSAEDAEECVNDAYLGAWNAIPPARPHPVLAYICKIVRNLSLKCYYRKSAEKRGGAYTVALEELEGCLAGRKRNVRPALPRGKYGGVAGPNDAQEALEAGELARMIEGFLDTLSAENRAVFLRRYWFCDTYRDIAARVGLSEKTVSVRLTRMRQRLKSYLKEQEAI